MVMRFLAKIRIYKIFLSKFKTILSKKMAKNFDQSECWKIKFHFKHEKYVPFESTRSIEFKPVLGFKIGYVVLEKFRVKYRKFSKNEQNYNDNFQIRRGWLKQNRASIWCKFTFSGPMCYVGFEHESFTSRTWRRTKCPVCFWYGSF